MELTLLTLPPTPTEVELTLAQPSRRGREAAEPSDVLLLLLRRDAARPGGGGGGGGGGGVRLVCCSNRSLGSVVGCEALLEPGSYVVSSMVH